MSSSVGMKAAFGVDEYLPFPMRESFPFLVSWPRCHSSVDREDSTFSGVGLNLVANGGMKKILIVLLVLSFALPAMAQVGRYKSLKTIYPGYSLKFDTATGELAVMSLDEETGIMKEEIISEKKSHGHKVGRYELRRSVRIASYQIFDTSTGEYTTVKWAPKEYDAEKIGGQVDTAVSKTIDKIKHLLRGLEESLEDLGPNKKDSPSDTINATV